jgi:hypothetical protein
VTIGFEFGFDTLETLETLAPRGRLLVPELLDRDGLKRALEDAGALRVNDDIVEGAAWRIFGASLVLWRCDEMMDRHLKKLRRLHSALTEWADDESSLADATTRLADRVGGLIQLEEFCNRHERKRGEEPLTTFYVRLYHLYVTVSGRRGLGNNKNGGPVYRFVRDCCALVDPSIVVGERGFRQRLAGGIARRAGVQKLPDPKSD